MQIGTKQQRKCMQKIRRSLFWLWMLCSLAGMYYTAQWTETMQDCLVLYDHLQEQDAGRWLKPLLQEMRAFPVQKVGKTATQWNYEDSYGDPREYGGRRSHQGIDIMAVQDEAGRLPVCSVSDGTVEKIGWLPLGGYRIGIRSASGLYYYYAHLDSYAEGITVGTTVPAGQVIGRMGDTGYGEEGTRGKFPVHLHFGIYYEQEKEEKSLDPFYLLRYVECGKIQEDR